MLRLDGGIWVSDGTPDGAWSVGTVNDPPADRLLFAHSQVQTGILSSLPVTAPAPPPGGWLESACMARTLCVSGAVPGRSEIFLRVPGPGPMDVSGRRWSSSQLEGSFDRLGFKR